MVPTAIYKSLQSPQPLAEVLEGGKVGELLDVWEGVSSNPGANFSGEIHHGGKVSFLAHSFR